MNFLKALARLLLIVCVSGQVPQSFAHVNGTDGGNVRAIGQPVDVTLARAVRAADGVVFTKDGVRFDSAGRPHLVHFDVPTARVGISPPGLGGPSVSHAYSPRREASRSSAPLRGPPFSI